MLAKWPSVWGTGHVFISAFFRYVDPRRGVERAGFSVTQGDIIQRYCPRWADPG